MHCNVRMYMYIDIVGWRTAVMNHYFLNNKNTGTVYIISLYMCMYVIVV